MQPEPGEAGRVSRHSKDTNDAAVGEVHEPPLRQTGRDQPVVEAHISPLRHADPDPTVGEAHEPPLRGAKVQRGGGRSASASVDPKVLAAADKRFIWHPFTPMQEWEKGEPLIIEAAKGSYLRDISGRAYLDGVSSLWTNIHGHRRREIDRAILRQVRQVSHSTLLGLANVPSILLAEKLVGIAPPGLSRLFYSDNGSTAVEVALKMAFQYWQQVSPEGRAKTRFISFKNGYHGDTIGAVGVGGISLFHGLYRPLLMDSIQVESAYCYRCPVCNDRMAPPHLEAKGWGDTPQSPRPGGAGLAPTHLDVLVWGDTPRSPQPGGRPSPEPPRSSFPVPLPCENCRLACLNNLEAALKAQHRSVAAVIIEPLVQAAGGMLVSPPGYLSRVRELCTRYRVLMIADEVAVGFGRTGRMFACEHEEIRPDLLCLAKGITGGYLPLAATLATEEVYQAFLGQPHEDRTFFHGHTYTGNPLACAAGLASLEVFDQDRTLERLQGKIVQMERGLRRFWELPHVGDIRQKGFMVGIELVADRSTKAPYPPEVRMGARVALEARPRGAILRPLGDVVVLVPPLSIKKREMDRLLEITYESIAAATGSIP